MLLIVPLTTIVSCDDSGDEPPGDAEWREVVVPLPSGVACSVEVTVRQPDGPVLPDGAVLPDGPVEVTGFATVGEAVPVANTTLVYVMDVSGSTAASGGCGGDPNGDGSSNTVLDCEIAALTELHGQATMLGTIANVGEVVFGEDADAADMVPGGTPNDPLTPPDADDGPGGGSNGVADAVDVLRSADTGFLGLFTPRFPGGGATNCAAGITEVATVLGASAQPSQIGVFLSDGLCNTGTAVADAVGALPTGASIHTFAVGASSDCDSDPTGRGSLRDIADLTGGTCTNVPDPADLPDVLPSVIMSELAGLELTVDGFPVVIDTITPSLPLEGPASVDYVETLLGLAPGEHTVCATATCTDASGTVDPVECKTFRINSPPEVECGDVTVYADHECQAEASILVHVTDPDGDAFSCEAAPPGPYPLGTTEVTLTCTDVHGASASCTADVHVVDVTPPEVISVGTLAELWPPNHQYEEFWVDQCVDSLSDNCAELDPAEATAAQRITSDEEERATGSGNTCDDILFDPAASASHFQLRSERAGPQDGRVYMIDFVVTDPSGNEATAQCQVEVPHDQGPGGDAVDSGCALCVGYDCGGCSSGDPAC